ncbi:MAG: D-amino acid dehydrogenase small subunit [Oceanospirillaceae bacterium]|uniref:D-amino acid dehydrogenase n=1 Tax=unclassified Thalassolituus TaxID=2624967 RepID=UPI000C0BAB69|nr:MULTISPECIES: D-amino acid dehydrogenase [unclassified Thalassolituus]MAK92499.1 D-amino acid dehydrogenase small subunit [Thalassolituus sp.]MAS25544.1 D-amino acid dehydrogenase small subunit [Oceanospirillaceae bacterium]MAX99136.1 D-amino acid dehydrogenase small subunit [Oceanospirillaceae bacterium]MBL36210.1 D-amino acid dehydrogenase small subunit [Oceanospirillaceae bacterium]MBS55110.1 D-amino acid dehydrogenase small subunit [Oceanospirillaceae bacterium]|tara:strand:+ start:6514 stop:7767 length:1254 start_codon:yes stop_codon:yes gene_type:complete
MKVLVLGSGVTGVTVAWYLAKAGHEVTVVDRLDTPATETSYANAGMLSFDYSTPWGAPGVPFKAIKWMMQDISPLYFSLKDFDAKTIGWMMKMLGQCSQEAFDVNKERMLRVARYSAECFHELNNEITIDYDVRMKGTLEVFRSQKEMDGAQGDVDVLKKCNVPHEMVDVATCIKHEPALANVKEKIVGGLYLPGDGTGDCYKFTNGLAEECKKLGVTFMMETEITAIETAGGSITGVQTSAGKLTADKYVVSLGSYSPFLLGKIGINAPIYPLKGYSLTMPITDESKAPVSTVMDQKYKVAVTRFEDRIRVGGIAEIANFNKDLVQKRRAAIEFSVKDLFPGGGDVEAAEFWTGLRPMTPDSVPIIGNTKYDNLVLNTGHGTLGWTMSLGTAKFVADVVSGKPTDINPDGLSIDRY